MVEPTDTETAGREVVPPDVHPWSWTGGLAPDVQTSLLLDESTTNEKAISLWRLVFCLVAAVQLLLHAGFSQQAIGSHQWVAIACVFTAVLYSATLFVVIGQRGYTTVLGYTSVGIDVSLISGALLALAACGEPLFAVNNAVSVPLYLLAISLAGLRYSPRVTVFATLLAAAQYVAVVVFAIKSGDLYNLSSPAVRDQVERFGRFDLLMQLTRLVLLASGGIIATYSVRRARELRTASVLDALTQVFNRGFFDERYRHEFERAHRYGRCLAVAIIDVDNFKRYNDRNGHLNGDQVLREVADILRYGVRSTDTVARYGGEEFVLLLPETTKEAAMALVDRLRQQVAQHSFLFGDQQPGGCLTISGGVASYPDDATEPLPLFDHADQALYQAKGEGRNRIQG